MQPLTITIPPESQKKYEIQFPDDFALLEKQIKDQIADRSFMVVTDKNVFQKTKFFQKANFPKEKLLILPPGEEHKNLTSIQKIWHHAFTQNCDRTSVFISIGGGVCGDMVGFAAATFKRGVPFIQVPTTLLSMVDASVGGKTGFDTDFGKNSLGAFHQPEIVLCCRPFLNSLEETEIRSGLGEMIKHAIIASEAHFQGLERMATEKPKSILDDIFALVPDSIEIKRKLVEADEKEAGIRAHLNLGHTYGHAIETLSDYTMPHGIAISIGTLMAINFAIEHEFCEELVLDRVENIYHRFGIETFCEYEESEIYDTMRWDKKVQHGKIFLVLPRKIGEVFLHELSHTP